jgi:RNA polymerase sigma-70 factor, ECF subfamily
MSLLVGDDWPRVLPAAQAGEEWAVALLFRAVQPALMRFLHARDPHDADDIASQTWLEVARALPGFEGNADNFRGFVFTIARRRMLNARRARFRRRVVPTDVHALADLTPDPEDPAAAVTSRLDADAAVARIVALLSDDQAEIVLLRVVAGLGVDEVADIVGKRPENVRVIQHRALKRLARALGEDDVTPPAPSGM